MTGSVDRDRVAALVLGCIAEADAAYASGHVATRREMYARIATRAADALAAPQLALDAARVRDAVREAAVGALPEELWESGFDPNRPRVSRLLFREEIAGAIAARAAEQLAGHSVPALTRSDAAALAKLIAIEHSRLADAPVYLSHASQAKWQPHDWVIDAVLAVAASGQGASLTASDEILQLRSVLREALSYWRYPCSTSAEKFRKDEIWHMVYPLDERDGRSRWICPVDSSECAIRRKCTNKCGRLDFDPAAIDGAAQQPGPTEQPADRPPWPPSARVPDPGPCTRMAHCWASGSAVCQCGQATRDGDCRSWKVASRLPDAQIREAVMGPMTSPRTDRVDLIATLRAIADNDDLTAGEVRARLRELIAGTVTP